MMKVLQVICHLNMFLNIFFFSLNTHVAVTGFPVSYTFVYCGFLYRVASLFFEIYLFCNLIAWYIEKFGEIKYLIMTISFTLYDYDKVYS